MTQILSPLAMIYDLFTKACMKSFVVHGVQHLVFSCIESKTHCVRLH